MCTYINLHFSKSFNAIADYLNAGKLKIFAHLGPSYQVISESYENLSTTIYKNYKTDLSTLNSHSL